MKIVSVFVFAFALIGSWMLVHTKKPISESVHAGIQNDLKRIISDYVRNNLPESHHLEFKRFWTETLSKDRVKAYFIYAFQDTPSEGESAEVEIEGSAILNKVNESDDMVTWSFDELQILNNTVNFADPIQITAGAGELESGGTVAPSRSESDVENAE
ncbi:MAG: hypothetical protein AB7G93_15150 [Bdellovibrionales bacterium]